VSDFPPVADFEQRRRALEPGRSFIVQAPAGSGKTELLIQRYLVLLACVGQPEEIAAITFTKKAAAEMRSRVLVALAAARAAPRPPEPHRALTWDSARAVLARDADLGWRLEQHPGRMRVQTMDALCLSLARQMPLVASSGAQPDVVEDASARHREAARATLAMIDDDAEAAADIAALMAHLDNDFAQAETLLATMLARRDQWLRKHRALDRARLEAALAAVRRDALVRVRALWPAEVPLRVAADARLEAWLDLCEELLTKKGGWRKQAAVPPGLAERPDLCAALHALRELPPPGYTDAQWETLGAISRLLRFAAAQLKVVFAEHGEVDFIEIAQGAIEALGRADAPTDLLLALDYRIRHILVDEFQDTSFTQFELLEKFTSGWQPGDGRTLFLVGDPMQSIYRFREAEVGLFLQARREGLGGVALEPLTLSVNFRSQADIVGWLNGAFPRILPREEDFAEGAVPYTPSQPVHPAEADAVRVHALFDGDSGGEAAEVARLVAAARLEGSVAILVRGRNHLERIVPALRDHGVRYRAIEIDPLERRQAVQDLLALARALAHPGDRLAWLSVLRSPCCGLVLADLEALCGPVVPRARGEARPASARSSQLDLFAGGDQAARDPIEFQAPDTETIWQAMHDPERIARLSDDGRARLERARAALGRARSDRLRGNLRERVEGAWLALGGPACVEDETELEDAQVFLDFLEGHGEAGEIGDFAAFEEAVAKLFAQPDLRADGSIQIMTIHKAKGLEFDTVIVAGLGSAPPRADKRLLLWIERTAAGTASPSATSLLLAPIKEAGTDGDPIYDYLAGLDAEREAHEDARLLYVAATRAKKHLHLLGCTGILDGDAGLEPKRPARGSLLEKLWPAVEADFTQAARAAIAADEDAARDDPHRIDRRLRRLPSDWTVPHMPPAADRPRPAPRSHEPERIEFSWAGETARRVGSVVHRWLQHLAADALSGWDARRLDSLLGHFRRELAVHGVDEAELDAAAKRVHSALAHALADPRGRWLLGPRREARNEYRLTAIVDGARRSIVIDRTFVDDDGRRWIVDYKTSSHEGAGLEGFLDRERERYAAQLAGYARLIGGERPRLGLYFPLVAGWREWEQAAPGTGAPGT
jgi:ATP-dependent helicase/nuclease subunit A